MSYQQASINSLNPALALMNALDAVIQPHPAWDFVEQVVNGTNTARVYKNLASVSGLPNDFFVIIWRSADNALSINFSLCESWDAAGKLMVRYAPAQSGVSGSGSFQPINADGSIGPTGQAFTSPSVLAATTTEGLLLGTAFPYYISVSNHRICFALRNQGWIYAGAYESLPGYYDPYPIILLSNALSGYGTGGGYGSSATGWRRVSGYGVTLIDSYPGNTSALLDAWGGSFTRQWRTTTQAASAFSVRPFYVSMLNPRRQLGTPYWNYRELLSGRWYPTRVGLNQGHTSLGNPNNDCRGLLRDVFAIDALDGYQANGDSMSIEGVDHVCMCRTTQNTPGEHFWVSKAV